MDEMRVTRKIAEMMKAEYEKFLQENPYIYISPYLLPKVKDEIDWKKPSRYRFKKKLVNGALFIGSKMYGASELSYYLQPYGWVLCYPGDYPPYQCTVQYACWVLNKTIFEIYAAAHEHYQLLKSKGVR